MEMKCAYCNEITKCSCPDHEAEKYKDAKHTCEVCIQLIELGVKEEELKTSPKREEARKLVESDKMASVLANRLMKDLFDGYWQGEKEGVKQLSKKDIAAQCHYDGLRTAFLFCIQMHQDGRLSELFDGLKQGIPQNKIDSGGGKQ